MSLDSATAKRAPSFPVWSQLVSHRPEDVVSADTIDSELPALTEAVRRARQPAAGAEAPSGTPLPSSSPSSFEGRPSVQAGVQIGPFVLEAAIGAGGMGAVWRARDTRLGRVVALKLLPDEVSRDPVRRARFLREARAAAAASHAHIATIYEVGDYDDRLVLAMELLSGGTLRQDIRPGGLPVADVVALVRQVAAGLAAAHAVGVVHRDIKPDNIMHAADGTLKILDYGLARGVDESPLAESSHAEEKETSSRPQLTREGQILGTPGYMAPEQAMGKPADARADIYALGVIAWELLAGRLPVAGRTSMELLIATVRDGPRQIAEVRPDVPPALRLWLDRALAAEPDRRFRDGAEALLALPALSETGNAAPFSVDGLTWGDDARSKTDADASRIASSVSAAAQAGPGQAGTAPKPETAVQRSIGRRRMGIALLALLMLLGGLAVTWAWTRPPPSMRDLPEVGGGAAGQAVFERAVAALYRIEYGRAAAEIAAARKAGADHPLLDVLTAHLDSKTTATTDPGLYQQAATRVGLGGDTAASLVRAVASMNNYTPKVPAFGPIYDALAATSGNSYFGLALLGAFGVEGDTDVLPRMDALLARDDAPPFVHSVRLGSLVGLSRYEQVVADELALEARGVVHPALMVWRAHAVFALGRRDEAKKLYNEVLRLDGSQIGAIGGLLELGLDGPREVLRGHEKELISTRGNRGEAMSMLDGHLTRLLARGRLAEAQQIVDSALQQNGLDGITAQLFYAMGSGTLILGYEPGRRWLLPHVEAGLALVSLGDQLRRWFSQVRTGLRLTAALRGEVSDNEIHKLALELASVRPQVALDSAIYTMQRVLLALRLGQLAEARTLLALAKTQVAGDVPRQMHLRRTELDVAIAERNETEVRRIVALVGARHSDCLRQILDAQQICRIQHAGILVHWRLFALDIGDEAAAKKAEADIRELVPGCDQDLLAFWLSDAVRFPWEVKPPAP